jgi:hypothetical protein
MIRIKHLLLISFLACSALHQLQAQQDSVYMCHADTTGGFHHGLAFVQFENPETANFYTEGLLWLTQPDGTASLTGNFIQPDNAVNGFVADIHLINDMTWDEWSNQEFPTSYIDDFSVVGDEYLDWMYYTIDGENSTLTGFGVYEGSELQVTHAPANLFYAYQVGLGANQRPVLEDGHGGWALVEGTYMNSETGASEPAFESPIDFYLAYGCEPETVEIRSQGQANFEILLYPNPVGDRINLAFESPLNIEHNPFTIHDTLGRTVLQDKVSLNALNVSALPPGNYVLAIQLDNELIRLRFIKE